MFKRMLVAVDGSSYSQRALKVALDLAKQVSAEVEVVYVIPTTPPYGGDKYGESIDRSYLEFLQNQGKHILETSERMVKEAKMAAKIEMLNGQPVEEILRYAKEHDSDLIVIGKRGTNPDKTFLLGGVSERVSRGANCTVLIVK